MIDAEWNSIVWCTNPRLGIYEVKVLDFEDRFFLILWHPGSLILCNSWLDIFEKPIQKEGRLNVGHAQSVAMTPFMDVIYDVCCSAFPKHCENFKA